MRTIITILIVSCCHILLAQQVVSTAGSTLSNANGSMSFTIGEVVAQTSTNGDKTITQGFHQTTVSVAIVSVQKDLHFTITAFPNPTSDILKLSVDKENIEGLQYLLFNLYGKLILQKKIEATETNVPIDQLVVGSYILKVQAGNKELKTFKIVKQ